MPRRLPVALRCFGRGVTSSASHTIQFVAAAPGAKRPFAESAAMEWTLIAVGIPQAQRLQA
jgi:hypothetical protein